MKKYILSTMLVCFLLCGLCVPSKATMSNIPTQKEQIGLTDFGRIRIPVAIAFTLAHELNCIACDDDDNVHALIDIGAICGEDEIFTNIQSADLFLRNIFGAERITHDGLYRFRRCVSSRVVDGLRWLIQNGKANAIIQY